ncbi:MAG: MFS transporter [Usitatibacter sp.]
MTDVRDQPDSPQAALRLAVTLLIMTLSASGMYVVPVVLPTVQAEFGIARADASLSYSMLMIGFGVGGVVMGRLADRFGVMWPLLLGGVGLGAGFVIAGYATGIATFNLAHGILIGLFGCSAGFAPLLADTALWWVRRRGMAVAICASGNYLGGAIWPPIVQRSIEAFGWRQTYIVMGVACGLAVVLLALAMRRRPPIQVAASPTAAAIAADIRPFGLAPNVALALLMFAGVSCCVAMSMPQVHIVAYCGDLGYGVARGAEMLAVMLGFGIASRLISGAICDRIGGLRTLLLGSVLQGIALLLFLPFKGLVSLYVISALFGLFQGGIVPAYAIIIREHFGVKNAGARTGLVIMCTLFGMALGGWMSGKAYDLTGSYQAAFLNGIAWNLLNLSIVAILLFRLRGRPGVSAASA